MLRPAVWAEASRYGDRELIYLDIAGVTFAVDSPLPRWQALVADRYAAFLGSEGKAGPAWRVAVVQDPYLAITGSPWISHDGPITTFRMADLVGRFDLSSCRAELRAPSAARAAAGLDRILAYVCMQILPREHDGLLLHAVAVVLDGAGHIFAGASGAGKTTVARLAAGRSEVLCDENVIIRLGPGGAELCSTPFWGASTPPAMVRRTNRRVPLAAIYLLAHAPEFQRSRLAAGQAVMALLTTEKVATERAESAAAWLAVAERLIAQVPIYHLGFRPTTELWEIVSASAPA